MVSNADLVFVHIPKCAGTWISTQLRRYARCTWDEVQAMTVGNSGSQSHQGLRYVRAARSICLASVRNPWDWYTSAWKQWPMAGSVQHRYGCDDYRSFPAWLKWALDPPERFDGVGYCTLPPLSPHWNKGTFYNRVLTYGDIDLATHIIKVEELPNALWKLLNIYPPDDAEGPINVARDKTQPEALYDRAAFDAVADAERDWIKAWGYDVDEHRARVLNY